MPKAKTPQETASRSQGTAVSVQKQYFQGKDPVSQEQVTNETISVRTFVTASATVSIEKGLTINLGNYESARVAVSISVPCYLEEADEAYSFADSWVETRLETEVQSIRSNKPSLF